MKRLAGLLLAVLLGVGLQAQHRHGIGTSQPSGVYQSPHGFYSSPYYSQSFYSTPYFSTPTYFAPSSPPPSAPTVIYVQGPPSPPAERPVIYVPSWLRPGPSLGDYARSLGLKKHKH